MRRLLAHIKVKVKPSSSHKGNTNLICAGKQVFLVGFFWCDFFVCLLFCFLFCFFFGGGGGVVMPILLLYF